MAALLQFTATPLNQLQFHSKTLPKHTAKWGTIRCSAASPSKSYNITLLPGDGIGLEVISVENFQKRLKENQTKMENEKAKGNEGNNNEKKKKKIHPMVQKSSTK
uniref:3-isopropylmalate dehydrogenase 3, chloroplastic-like n=1 Tax=Nicotiana sylvestris TaxID=4096 RepID=A0A1U7VUB8_NICSY|nr:PREDICTED: 3-isopropylmalate dehydrogenase 3, chloroplastic-like [Nicotiana sylvestris]